MTAYLLKNVRIVDPPRPAGAPADILIVDGVIKKIGPGLKAPDGAVALDFKGAVAAPGFFDMHVHFREPGFEHKETIATGCASAAAGGFTGVACMPNTDPPLDNAAWVRYVREKGRESLGGAVDVHAVAAVTAGRAGQKLSPMAELAAAGAVGFSDDGAPVSDPAIMRNALQYARRLGKPLIQHAEEHSLTKGGAMNEGHTSTLLGLPGIPSVAEEIMVDRDLRLVRYSGARYHVAHISTAGAVEAVRRAKAEGLPVTCETTPHHFCLTDEVVEGFDTNTKMNPPLRTGSDVTAIVEGLKDGTIDAIATDHAPHSIDEKQVEYVNAPFGIVGLETAIGLAVTTLVRPGTIDLARMVELFSTNPRKILGLPQVSVREGERANITVFDPEASWTVDPLAFQSKSKNTPFGGRNLHGKALAIFNNGTVLNLLQGIGNIGR